MKKNRSIASNAAILTVSGLAVKVIGFFFKIPLGRIITASGMGDYAPAYEMYSFALIIATAGIPVAIAKMVAERIAVGEYKNAIKVFKLSRRLMIMIGLAGFIALFFGGEIIADFINMQTAALSIKATSFALIIVPVVAAYRGFFQGTNDMVPTAVSEVVEQLFRTSVGLLLAILFYYEIGISSKGASISQLQSKGAVGACLGASIGAVAALIVLIGFYRNREIETGKERLDRSIEIILELIRIALPITLTASILSIVNLIDISIVQTRLLDLGYSYNKAKSMYGELTSFAAPIIGIPMVFVQSLGISLLPAVAKDYKLNNIELAIKKTEEAFTIASSIIFPCAIGLFILAEPILKLLYGSQISADSPSVRSLRVYAICFVFIALTTLASSILQSIGRQRASTEFMIIGIIFKTILTWVLTGIEQVNVLGAPIGTTVAYIISSILDLRFLKRKIDYSLQPKRIIHILLLSLLMGAFVIIVFMLLNSVFGNGFSVLMSIAVGIIMYFALGFRFRIIPIEIIEYVINRGR